MTTAQRETVQAIYDGVTTLVEPGSVVEVRILNTAKATVSGYYTDTAKLADDVARWDGKAPAVYATLNPVLPDLLARAVNRLREYAKDTTQDTDILRRRWLPLDFDPVRPTGISSTDVEHEAALDRARQVRDHLAGGGWPDPVFVDSGNGAHLLYPVTVPNSSEALQLVTRCLEALAFQFSDDRVQIDLKVGNAARIWKLPGTLACKGDSTADRPHRRSRILERPAGFTVVPTDLLDGLATLAPAAENNGHGAAARFDMDAFLAAHPLPVVNASAWQGGRKWVLNPCPWNADHTNRSAYIVQHASGALAAGCHHNGCHGKGWHELRDLVEPGWRAHKDASSEASRAAAPRPDVVPLVEAPVAVLRTLRDQGDPVSTGVGVLDQRTRGGMRPGKALVVGGTAGAGKTALVVQAMRAAAEAGCVVKGLFSDEGREPAIIRLGQSYGYERDALEAVDHPAHETALAALELDLAGLDIFFPDPDADADVTLETVVGDLVQTYPDRRKVVVVDSIQTVRTEIGRNAPSLRERIMGNARLARALAVEHGLVMIYTSEVNRSWYRSRKEEDRASDLAAFAEARIEFSGDVLLAMRALDEDPDLVDCRIPKNRLGTRQSFLLRLDRMRARFEEVGEEYVMAKRTEADAKRGDEAREEILRNLRDHPGVTRRQLQELVGLKVVVFSDGLKHLKATGMVRTEPKGTSVLHYLAEVPK